MHPSKALLWAFILGFSNTLFAQQELSESDLLTTLKNKYGYYLKWDQPLWDDLVLTCPPKSISSLDYEALFSQTLSAYLDKSLEEKLKPHLQSWMLRAVFNIDSADSSPDLSPIGYYGVADGVSGPVNYRAVFFMDHSGEIIATQAGRWETFPGSSTLQNVVDVDAQSAPVKIEHPSDVALLQSRLRATGITYSECLRLTFEPKGEKSNKTKLALWVKQRDDALRGLFELSLTLVDGQKETVNAFKDASVKNLNRGTLYTVRQNMKVQHHNVGEVRNTTLNLNIRNQFELTGYLYAMEVRLEKQATPSKALYLFFDPSTLHLQSVAYFDSDSKRQHKVRQSLDKFNLASQPRLDSYLSGETFNEEGIIESP